ncbi:MAG: phage portal protein [bacterium]
MSLRTFVRALLYPEAQTESHSIDKMKLWGTGEDIGDPVHAGVLISQESARRLSVVYRCQTLISGTLAGMPADAVRKRGDVREPVDRPPGWLEQPNPETNWFEFHERVTESELSDGNAFILITLRDGMGFPSELWTLDPQRIQVRKDGRGVYFLWNGDERLSRYSPSTPTGDVLHIRLNAGAGLRGISPVEAARQAIGLGLVAEKFGARFFGRGQTMSGVIELPVQEGGVARSREYVELMRETWETEHSGADRAHRPGVLTGGGHWVRTSVTPEEAQFLDTRKFQVEDIASRIYGVPPHMVGLQGYQSQFGTGLEQQTLGFIKFTLLPYIIRHETAFSTLLPRGQFVRLNQRALLRADSKTEAEVLQILFQNSIIDVDDWLALLDRPPVPGGSRRVLPVNFQVLTDAGQAPAPAPTGNGKVPAEVSP